MSSITFKKLSSNGNVCQTFSLRREDVTQSRLSLLFKLCRSPNPSSIAARLQGADELFKEYLRVSGEVEPTTSQAVSSINNNTTTSAFALPNVSVSGSDTSLVELY